MTPQLHHFRFSHFNEKARWALDHKRIPHRRRAYLPGLHMVPLMLLSRQHQVPVLRDGATVVAGSSAIIDHLERTHPEPRLYPADPASRVRALEIQARFDDQIAPPLRAAFFHTALTDPTFLASTFAGDRSPLARRLYCTIFPAIAVVMRRNLALSVEAAEIGLRRTEEALELVATRAGAGGYLVGDQFSIADLTAAAILAPTTMPAEFPYPPPQPYAPVYAQWLARWSDHPGTTWVREIYRRHRGTSAELR
jgi:glutathione S-transferase